MGRKRKQIDLEEAIEEKNNGAGVGHNKPSALTAEERQALHFRHCREYETALSANKKTVADLKNVGKRIKAEDDSVAKCKKTLLARTNEGEAALKAEIAETAEVLRWSGTSVGETAQLFPEDRTPSVDKAYAQGKRAGMDGQPRNPGYDPSVPQHGAWLTGWADGQLILSSAFQKIPSDPPTADLPHADTSDVPFAVPDEPRTTSAEDPALQH